MITNGVTHKQLRTIIESHTHKAFIELEHARREHDAAAEHYARGRVDGALAILEVVDPRSAEHLRTEYSTSCKPHADTPDRSDT